MAENREHGGASHAMDKMQDAVGAVVGKMSAAMGGGASTEFVKNAALSDRYEIAAADIAMRRSKSEQVRSFAAKMVEDHMTSTHQLQSALQMSETDDALLELLDEELDSRRAGLLDHLERAPDDDFDKTYLDQQVAAHEEGVTLFRNYAGSGDNPQLRSLAMATLPVLERHRHHVKELRSLI